MYLLNESLFHFPNVWMVESANPFAAAVVVAPIRNECPENLSHSTPALDNVVLRPLTNCGLVNGEPSQ